ncbi:hypothetical protein PHLCEN_2v12348 [Hermanssonia centrifuga]|uniref:Uncharacterized protein n=1 Tax=Hermanssonia centrifuga TaxID=98765 RepID=A0A2R6NHH8_9APHY|nr:hypothetical protein PHLCEN_2v12348 [Hermanssonia centrifuga]
MSGNVAGRTKQVIATSLVFVAWAVGNAIGPQALRIRLMRLNAIKRRAQGLAVSEGEEANEAISHKHAFDDLTDKENPDS